MSASHDRLILAGTVAALAALAASIGDVLLVAVGRAGAGATDPRLIWGHYLGVFGIPFYALGYWQVGRVLRAGTPRRARVVFLCGAFAGALGAAIHGLTSLVIFVEPGEPGDPFGVFLAYRHFLLPLWGVATLLVLAASIAFTSAVLGGRSGLPRAAALANPAGLVLILALGMAVPSALRDFAVTAPNVAHLLFFALCTFWLRGRRAV